MIVLMVDYPVLKNKLQELVNQVISGEKIEIIDSYVKFEEYIENPKLPKFFIVSNYTFKRFITFITYDKIKNIFANKIPIIEIIKESVAPIDKNHYYVVDSIKEEDLSLEVFKNIISNYV